jgi:1-acyl-sn-glycerol-3-phosphate acyltransferase
MPERLNTTWKGLHLALKVVMHAMFHIRFVDGHNLPTDGPAIVAPNHISPLDPLVIGLYPVSLGRPMRYLSGTEFFAMRWVGKGLRALDQIPLRRGDNDLQALGAAVEAAQAGGLVGLFPEGKINNEPAVLRGRRGAARIAVASGAPLLPVGIWGTQVRFPGGGWKLRRPWRPTVVVVFGEPIRVDTSATSAKEILAITNELMARVEELRDRAKELAGRKGYSW